MPDQTRVMEVTMIEPFFDRFKAWAYAQGFLVSNIPGVEDPDKYVVVPGEELMRRIAQDTLREED